jgi:hypothetical protein
MNIVTFQDTGRFINPSRSDPRKIILSKIGNNEYACLPLNGPGNTIVVFTSSIVVTECKLVYGTTGAIKRKYIRGLFHSQEYERMVAYMCMIYQVEAFSAPIYGEEPSINFSTFAEKGKHN